jgi:hypothetical protein
VCSLPDWQEIVALFVCVCEYDVATVNVEKLADLFRLTPGRI